MTVIIDGTTGITTPSVTDTGNLSVSGSTTLTTPLPVASGGTGATSLSGITVGTATTATTSTNLASGVAGAIPYQSGSGTTGFSAAGSSGQVLTSAGVGTPTWSTPSTGAMTLISKQTVTSQNPITWTGLSTYTNYLLIYTLGISASDAYLVQVGTGATPTWTTSNYNFGGNGYNQTNGVVSGSGYSASGFDLMGNMESGQYSGAPYLTGQCFITNALVSSSVGFTAQSFVNNPSRALNVAVAGSVTGVTAPITAIRLYTNGGNVYTGIISLYGIS